LIIKRQKRTIKTEEKHTEVPINIMIVIYLITNVFCKTPNSPTHKVLIPLVNPNN